LIKHKKMDIEIIVEKLKREKRDISLKFNVCEIGLFGSYVKNEQTKKSDVDILVDFSKPIGWDVVELQEHLQSILGVRVDLVLKKGLMRNKKLWKIVKPEVVYV